MILELSPMVANRYTLPVVLELEILTIGRNMILELSPMVANRYTLVTNSRKQ